jgi:hypothetical protein
MQWIEQLQGQTVALDTAPFQFIQTLKLTEYF